LKLCLLKESGNFEKNSHWSKGYNSWYTIFGRSMDLAEILYAGSTY